MLLRVCFQISPVRQFSSMARIVPGVGWFDDDYLGIDQGPILVMLENWRTGLVWKYTRNNIHFRRGLRNAGFTGGWLESWRNRGMGGR